MKNIKGNMFRDLQIFRAVVEFKNYTDAALKLGIDNSSVSRRVKALEAKLNHLLVIKNGRDLRITAEGMTLYNEFIEQERAFSKMLVDFQEIRPITHTTLISIAIPNGLIEYILSPKLSKFTRDNPDIKLNLVCHNLNINVIEEKFDFVITRDIPKQDHIAIQKIYAPKFYLYCTSEYVKQYGTPMSLIELSEHMIIRRSYPNGDEPLCFYASDGVETLSLVNNSRFSTSSSTTDKNIVMGHDAIVSGTDALYKDELASGQIVKVLPQYHFVDEFKAFYLVYDENRIPNKMVQKLIDFIIEVFNHAEIS